MENSVLLQPAVPDMSSKVWITVTIILAMFQVRSEQSSLNDLASWIKQSALCRPYQKRKEDEELEIDRMMNKARAQIFKSTLRFSCVLLAFFNALNAFLPCSVPIGFRIFILLTYAAVLFSASSEATWVSSKITQFTIFLNFVMLVRTMLIQDPTVWFLFYTNRVIYRLVVGSVDMQIWRATMWNTLFCIANIWKGMEMAEEVSVLQLPLSQRILHEVCLCVIVSVAMYFIEAWFRVTVRTGIESASSRINETMASNLASAFCDVQVKLGCNLRILEPSEKLSHILCGGEPATFKGLQGGNFSDHLAEGDKARFTSFIESSSRASSVQREHLYERLSTLPSAIHVHLRDASGREIPTELFHSTTRGVDGEVRHLIGICVDSPEEHTEMQPRPMSLSEKGRHSPCLHDNLKTNRSSRSLRSSSSSRTSHSSSRMPVQMTDIPEIKSLSLEFDPFELSLQSLHVVVENTHCCHQIASSILQPSQFEFSKWIQEQIQDAFHNLSDDVNRHLPSELYGPLTLAMPSLPLFGQTVFSAKSAWLDFECLPMCAADDDSDYLVALRLEGLQLIKSSRKKQIMATIGES